MHIEEKNPSKPKIRLKKRNQAIKSCSSSISASASSSSSSLGPPPSYCNNTLDRFILQLLDWDVFSTPERKEKDLPSVPMTFASYRKYVETWEPLLIEEIRASILSSSDALSLDDSKTIIDAQIPSDLTTSLKPMVTIAGTVAPIKDGSSLQDNAIPVYMDILLLSVQPRDDIKPKKPSNGFVNISRSKPKCPPNTSTKSLNKDRKMFLGIVGYQGFSNDLLVTCRRKDIQSCVDNSSSVNIAQVGIDCRVLAGLTSSWREYLALHDANRMPLLDHLLNPSASISGKSGDKDIAESVESKASTWYMAGVGDGFNNHLKHKFNPSQLKALQCAVEKKRGFSLIQGPPGTGKTTTIMGILNALHVRDYNNYFESVLDVALGPAGVQCRKDSQLANGRVNLGKWSSLVNGLSSNGARPHLLVTAPSNVAVNNIIEKIVANGFVDSSGSSYYPNILRIGSSRSTGDNPNINQLLAQKTKSVSLDEVVGALLLEEVEESVVDMRKDLEKSSKEILHLQSILLNLKQCFTSHRMNKGWELRVNFENAAPYWVDHERKTTTPSPPKFDENKLLAYNDISSLPEYKVYSHALVQRLEQFRVAYLKYSRIQAIIQHRAECGDRKMASLRQTLESSFVEEADIVFSTLNSAGHPCLEASCFPVVICDEAAQCVEVSTLIPLRHGATQCVMVGDHKQLSATTFSRSAALKGFDISLFERLQTAVDEDRSLGKSRESDAVMLNTQYRMLPQVSQFPSDMFYNSKLIDGENVKMPFYAPSYLDVTNSDDSLGNCNGTFLKPFIFFDLPNGVETTGKGSSYSNKQEALVCLELIKTIVVESKRMHSPLGPIAVITPYQDQLSLIRCCIGQYIEKCKRNANEKHGIEEGELPVASATLLNRIDISQCDVEVNTVDGFQGREKDVVIFSCVRSNEAGNIGFLSDKRRMNVALTRAKFGLYIVGNAHTLRSNHVWESLILHATKSGSSVTVKSENESIKSILSFPATNYKRTQENNSGRETKRLKS